jgi:GT2 family glycosyltransferase
MISIVTAYYNRKKQFIETLKSIKKSCYKDFEFIVVDDGSTPENRLENLVGEFPFMKIIRVEPKDKWYVNPCVPFNVGIRAAKGEILVLQNPECLHIHDVLTYIGDNIDDTKYLTISAYALDEIRTNVLVKISEHNALLKFFKALPQKVTTEDSNIGWYNHSKFRPSHFHFCAAITKKNMDLLNGFDERYASGIACDDAEFVIRINRLGLKKIICDEVSVIHQWHPTTYYSIPNAALLREKNGVLLNVTKNESGFKAYNLTINESINDNGNKT